MKRLSLRIAIALFTFVVGVSVATALIVFSRFEEPRSDDPSLMVHQPEPENIGEGEAVLEMVFVLDTTGSMSGLLEGAKQRIWGIVNEVMQSPSRPAVRIGLVAYRDRGDRYVTQVLPLTSDLDKVYSTLMDYRAEGGGDGPENVRRALADGVRRAGWSQKGSSRLAQIIFLVGDAPPHEDYRDEPDTATTAAEAVRKGMIINTIQCGTQGDTKRVWQSIASHGQGQYFSIAQDGGVRAISTPFDEPLAALGSRIGSTYMAYGGGAGTAGRLSREEAEERQEALEATVATTAAPVAKAERALNKALNKEAYARDLIQSLENGNVTLDSVRDEDLPDELQKLAPAERSKEVEKRLTERRKLREEIVSLSKQRDEFLAAERKKESAGKQGFDAAVSAALKEQLARKGLK